MCIRDRIIKHTIGLRVSEEEEIKGLDSTEHGLVSAYADFSPVVGTTSFGLLSANDTMEDTDPVAPVKAVPVQRVAKDASLASDVKMTKITIVTKQTKFEELKLALNDIGVSGITVTQVLGCGMQKGAMEYYRGVPLNMTLLPKIKIDIIVCKVPVETVIETAKKVLYTGHIGDGKIFVYDVENVIKVRTGEEGYDALQDVE